MGVAKTAVVIVGWYMDHATIAVQVAKPWNVGYVLAWSIGGERGKRRGGKVESEIVVVEIFRGKCCACGLVVDA